jgi:hypothetical protein
MKEQLPEQENQSLDDIDGACLVIECSSDGELSFSCDWQLDETGITCMATILASLDDKQITLKIIKNLEEIYHSDQDRHQIEKLNVFYKALKKIANQHKKRPDDEIVISPLDASSLI